MILFSGPCGPLCHYLDNVVGAVVSVQIGRGYGKAMQVFYNGGQLSGRCCRSKDQMRT